MAVTVTEHVHFDRPITTVYATPSCNESSSLLSSLIFRYAIGKAVEKTLRLQSLHLLLTAVGLHSPQLRPDCRVAYLE